MKKICLICNEEYNGKRNQMYCSRKCRGIADKRKNRVTVYCSQCGNEASKTKKKALRSIDHYCSKECQAKHYKTKFNGQDNPNWKGLTQKIRCDNCNKEFVYTDYYNATNNYCSYKCKSEHQEVILKGANNPNYRMDKPDYLRIKERKYTGYNEWRLSVLKRDNYNCCKCGTNTTVDNKLVAHHIRNHYSYPEGRIDVNNGITLCTKCHWKFHKLYGTMHNNKNQIKEFLR